MSNSKYRKTNIERKPPTNYKPKRETLISAPLNVGDVLLLAVVDCRLKDVEKKTTSVWFPRHQFFSLSEKSFL